MFQVEVDFTRTPETHIFSDTGLRTGISLIGTEIDRGFDESDVVLLQGFKGSGKTSSAITFADWYKTSGGVAGDIAYGDLTGFNRDVSSILQTPRLVQLRDTFHVCHELSSTYKDLSRLDGWLR